MKFVKHYTSAVPSGDHLRNRLIIEYSPLIRFIAHRIAVRLPPNVEIEDLMNAGVIGLMDAIDKYDPSRDNRFKTYAEFRIRGAILDELRSQDWVPRSVRDKAKKIDRMHIDLERKLGRPANEIEVSEALGMGLNEYQELAAKVRSITVLSVEEMNRPSNLEKKNALEIAEVAISVNPFSVVRDLNTRDVLIKSIDTLPEKQKLVLSLYYYEELNLKEIGKILDVTESRVSQLHSQAIERLKRQLKGVLEAV
jgi:RNA polymerase sigma factor for flagellar operon FliA